MYEQHLHAPHTYELDVEFFEAKHQPNVLEVNNNLAIVTYKSWWWYSCGEGIDLNQRCSHIPVMQPLHRM